MHNQWKKEISFLFFLHPNKLPRYIFIHSEADGPQLALMQGLVCCDECYNVNIKYGLITIHSRSPMMARSTFNSVYIHFYQLTIPALAAEQSAINVHLKFLFSLFTIYTVQCEDWPLSLSIQILYHYFTEDPVFSFLSLSSLKLNSIHFEVWQIQ